jgi:hypothetical protein
VNPRFSYPYLIYIQIEKETKSGNVGAGFTPRF